MLVSRSNNTKMEYCWWNGTQSIDYIQWVEMKLYYINQMLLGKQNTSAQTSIEMSSFIFLLKRIGNSSNAPYVQVDFSPQSTTPIPTNISHSIAYHKNYPVFNQDLHHFTPTFLLMEDQTKIQKNLHSYLNLHEERVKEATQQREQIYVPKPSKVNSFCSICKIAIDDYLTHLNTPSHQSMLRSSPFCQDIVQMCSLFVQKEKKIVKKNKTKAKVGRKCRTVKQDISQANYTTTSAMSLEQCNMQKVIQVY